MEGTDLRMEKIEGKINSFFHVVVLIGPAPGVCPCLLNIIQQAVRYAP